MNETNEHNPLSENKGGDEPCAQSATESTANVDSAVHTSRASKAPVAVQSHDQGQSARIAELERRVEELTEERDEVMANERAEGVVTDAMLTDLRARLLKVEAERDKLAEMKRPWVAAYEGIEQFNKMRDERDSLRADAERLTKERDVYRGDVVRISTQANALGSRAEKAEQKRDNLRAQLAEREERLNAVLLTAETTLERSLQQHGCDPCHITEALDAIRAARAQPEDGK